jgi:hypothetical protein
MSDIKVIAFYLPKYYPIPEIKKLCLNIKAIALYLPQYHPIPENDEWLGDSVCVLPNVTIGENSIICANSVVNKDIPPNVVAAGVSAYVIKTLNLE